MISKLVQSGITRKNKIKLLSWILAGSLLLSSVPVLAQTDAAQSGPEEPQMTESPEGPTTTEGPDKPPTTEEPEEPTTTEETEEPTTEETEEPPTTENPGEPPLLEKISAALSALDTDSREILLNWDAVKNAVGYQISQEVNGTWETICNTTDIEIKIQLNETDKLYSYRIAAFGTDGKEIARSATVQVGIPVIEDIATTAQSKTKVKVSWKKSEIAQEYIVYRKKEGGSYKKLKTVQKCDISDKVSFESTYKYKIVPVYMMEEGTIRGKAATVNYQNSTFVSIHHQKYTYKEMKNDIKQLKAKYSDYVQVSVIGTTKKGRKIYDFAIGNPNAQKKLLVVSTLHAREYVATVVCMSQAEYYLLNYNKKIDGKRPSDIFENCQVHYVMMANPDGVTLSQKSKPRWKANASGVDLNRNFPYKFKVQGKRGSSGYTGKKAGSEAETQAIIKLTKKLKKQGLCGVVNYHAMGSIVFGDYSGDKEIKKTISKMYWVARNTTGYRDKGKYSSGRGSNGNYRGYVMYNLKIPSITIEVGHTLCPIASSYYPAICKKNRYVILREAALFSESE